MATRIFKGKAKLYLEAGKAKPSPQVGQAIGPLALNMADVCRMFNEQSSNFKEGTRLRAFVTAYEDRTYDLLIKGPTTTSLLKAAAGKTSGANHPGKQIAGTVDARQIYEIAKIKMNDPGMRGISHFAMSKSVAASARSMGFHITI